MLTTVLEVSLKNKKEYTSAVISDIKIKSYIIVGFWRDREVRLVEVLYVTLQLAT